jgi:putative endonuclease
MHSMVMAWVYIMANRKFGVVYVGATNDLVRRVWEHKNDLVPSFTKTHRCHLLVYYEQHQDIHRASSASTTSSTGCVPGRMP